MSRILLGDNMNGDPPAPLYLDVDVLIRTRMLITANSGKGKSFLVRRLCELLIGKVQVIVIDPDGEFSTLREKFDYVLVGKGGETAAHPRLAEATAHRLLELRACAVVDLYELKKNARHEYVRNFFTAMIEAPKNLWHPVVVIGDECHIYCPEKGKGESVAKEAVIEMGSRGRKRGFCLIAATQRLAKLDKDLAAELLNVAVGGTFIDIDRARAADTLGVYGKSKNEFDDEIRQLHSGLFYVLGPALANQRTLVQVGGVTTTHPEAGSAKHATSAPPTPAKIQKLLPKLADLPKEEDEKQQTVADLKTRIRELEAANRHVAQSTPSKEALDRASAAAVRTAIAPLVSQIGTIKSKAAAMIGHIRTATVALGTASAALHQIAELPAPQVATPPPPAPVARPQIPTRPAPAPELNATDPDAPVDKTISPGMRKIIAAAVQFQGIDLEELSVMTGYKATSRNEYIARTIRAGLVEKLPDRKIYPTAAGTAALGQDYEALPTGHALYKWWIPRLPDGELKILKYLVESKSGAEVDKQELAENTNFKTTSVNEYSARLGRRRLVVRGVGTVKASESLFG
jgi:uncharacterized protein